MCISLNIVHCQVDLGGTGQAIKAVAKAREELLKNMQIVRIGQIVLIQIYVCVFNNNYLP